MSSAPNGLALTGANRTRKSIAPGTLAARLASGAAAELGARHLRGPSADGLNLNAQIQRTGRRQRVV